MNILYPPFALLSTGKNMTSAVPSATSAYTGFVNVLGGSIPRITSLRTPPPVAVTSPRIATPKMSIFFSTATSAPDTAKATVPMISSTTTSISKTFYPVRVLL